MIVKDILFMGALIITAFTITLLICYLEEKSMIRSHKRFQKHFEEWLKEHPFPKGRVRNDDNIS